MSIVEHQLGSAHLEHLLVFERSFPPALRHGRDGLESKLAFLEDMEAQMSWILSENGVSVGYIIVFPRQVDLGNGQYEKIIFVDDIFVKQGYEYLTLRLIKLFSTQAKEIGLGDLAIEAYTRVRAYRTFSKHNNVFKRFGWNHSGKYEYWDDKLGEEMCWLRWDKYHEAAAAISVGDSFRRSREEADDFDEPAKKLISLEDSAKYGYIPKATIPAFADEVDEFDALTQVMLGAEDEDLVEIIPAPPVSRVADVFGIQEFFGTRTRARREKIIRRPKF